MILILIFFRLFSYYTGSSVIPTEVGLLSRLAYLWKHLCSQNIRFYVCLFIGCRFILIGGLEIIIFHLSLTDMFNLPVVNCQLNYPQLTYLYTSSSALTQSAMNSLHWLSLYTCVHAVELAALTHLTWPCCTDSADILVFTWTSSSALTQSAGTGCTDTVYMRSLRWLSW